MVEVDSLGTILLDADDCMTITVVGIDSVDEDDMIFALRGDEAN